MNAATQRLGFAGEVSPDGQTPSGYLYRSRPLAATVVPLGNRVELSAKVALECYVREIKKAGHPATETRVMEAMMLLLEHAPVRQLVTNYLTGKPATGLVLS